MTFDYAKSRSVADKLIKRFGQSGFIRREVPGAGPPYNPGPPTITDYPCTLVETAYSNHELEGSRILASDKKVLIAAGGLAVEPTPSDKVVIGGKAFSIVAPNEGNGVKPLSPGGVVIMFEAHCRA